MARIFVTCCFYRVSVTINVCTGPNNRSSMKDWAFTHGEQVKWIVRILQQGFFSFFCILVAIFYPASQKWAPQAALRKWHPHWNTPNSKWQEEARRLEKSADGVLGSACDSQKILQQANGQREPGWDVRHEETLNAFGKCLFSVTRDYGYVLWILLWPVEFVESLFQQL